MTEEPPTQSDFAKSLRQRAEKILRTKHEDTPQLPTIDVKTLLNELQIHQTELEIQNQELRETQLRLTQSRDRLSDLFEYAPVGYLTLDPQGKILEANLTASQMLNVTRSNMIGSALSNFVSPQTQDRLHIHLRSVFKYETTQSCEIEVRFSHDSSKHLRLDTLVTGTNNERQLRMSLVDITTQKEMEAALRESEQRFRDMANDLPLIVWLHNADGELEFVNRTYCEYFGVNQEEMRENRWEQLLHPDDMDAYRDHFFQCLQARKPFHAEVRVKRVDGEWRSLESWGRPRTNERGTFLGMLGTSADITERKQAEEEVKAMNATLEERVEERTEALLMLADIATIANEMIDVESASRRILERIGQHNGWIAGHCWLNDPEVSGNLRLVYHWYSSEFSKDDQLWEQLNLLRGKHGQGLVGRVFAEGQPEIIRDIEAHLASYQIDIAQARNIRGIVGYPIVSGETIVGVLEFFSYREIEHSDELLRSMASVGMQLGRVIERQRASLSLKEREERLTTILETAADAIVAVNLHGEIEHINPATERIFGYPEKELIGSHISNLVSTERAGNAEWFFSAGRVANREAAGPSVEAEGRRKNGTRFSLELSVSRVDHSQIFTIILRDISQRKAEQEQLLQSERLAAIGETMTGLVHESRNALARSQSSLNRLERRLSEDPEMMELIESIQSAQDDIAHQFEKVRAYAAPLVLNRTPEDLRSVLEKTWSHLSALYEDRDATLRFTTETTDFICEVDEYSIRDVFRNLLENSLSACEDPVLIDINLSESELRSQSALRISIRDNGPGFSEEAKSRAFESFFTTKTQGTGLGLSIVKRVVEAHDGEVKLNSIAGEYAEIVMLLPRTVQ